MVSLPGSGRAYGRSSQLGCYSHRSGHTGETVGSQVTIRNAFRFKPGITHHESRINNMDLFEKINRSFGGWYEGLFGGGDDVRPKDILRKILTAMEEHRKE